MNGHNATAPDPLLSADERAEIDAMYALLGGTYYEILGVPRGCDQAALRDAYRARCARFHPELYEDVELGRYRTYLDAIFREVTNAFEVLCRADLRAVYDGSLPPLRSPAAPATSALAPQPLPDLARAPAPLVTRAPTPPLEYRPVAAASIAVGAPQMQSGPVARKTTPTALVPPGTRSSPPAGVPRVNTPPGGSVAPAPLPPVEAAPFRAPGPAIPVPGTLKRTPTAALMNGGLTGMVKRATTSQITTPRPTEAPPSPPAAPPSVRPPSSPSVPPVDPETTRAAMARLRAESMIKHKRQQREEIEADIAAASSRNDGAKVIQLLKHALTLEPDDAGLKRRLEVAESGNVDRIAQQAKAHERGGRWDLAAELWSRAAASCPGEFSYHLYAAQAFCESGTELSKAADLARKATRLKPDSAEAHVCLARAFFKAGRVASARSAIEAAMLLAPQHPAVVDLARQLRL